MRTIRAVFSNLVSTDPAETIDLSIRLTEGSTLKTKVRVYGPIEIFGVPYARWEAPNKKSYAIYWRTGSVVCLWSEVDTSAQSLSKASKDDLRVAERYVLSQVITAQYLSFHAFWDRVKVSIETLG